MRFKFILSLILLLILLLLLWSSNLFDSEEPNIDFYEGIDGEIKDFIVKSEIPVEKILLMIINDNITLFRIVYAVRCSGACEQFFIVGLKNNNKIGWIHVNNGYLLDTIFNGSLEWYDFDENDEFLYRTDFENINMAGIKHLIYYNMVKDPDTPESKINEILIWAQKRSNVHRMSEKIYQVRFFDNPKIDEYNLSTILNSNSTYGRYLELRKRGILDYCLEYDLDNNNCLINTSIDYDSEFCELYSDYRDKGWCYLEMASIQKNVSYCEKQAIDFNYCYNLVNHVD